MIKRFLSGLVSLVTLTALLVGIPIALILLAGNPIPTWDELVRVLTGPDYGGLFLIGSVLPIIGWVAWATMAVAILVEIPAQLRRVPTPRIPGLGVQQRGASVLVAAVIGMFGILAPTAATAAEVPTSTGVSYSASVSSADSTTVVVDVASATDAPTYVVQDGDSLWAIAESQLGNGKRWNEIAQLNYGVEQTDGWSLTAQHWLNAGWVLTLPADTTSTPTVDVPAPGETQHVVEEGESLWSIAQDTLGDGSKFTEIYDANARIPQANGNQLSDPGSIDAGWVLEIPTAPSAAPVQEAPVVVTPTQEAPVTEEVPTEIPTAEDSTATAPDMSGLGIAPTAETPAAAEAPANTTVDQADAGSDWIDEAFNLRTLGGIGAIAAAGILSVLGIRRMKQRRQRRHGERIAMPAGEAATMELELRAVENPLGMEAVDHALRYLAAWTHTTTNVLPPLYALRFADDEIALYLDAPSDLPEPFVAVTEDKMAWTIDPALLPPLEVVPTAPWPALVSLGYDQGEAQLLVDLEHLGALNVTGTADVVEGALAALALELATTPWAQDLQITLVDVAPGLASAVDTGRVRHIDNVEDLLRGLRAQAASTQNALDELGVSTIEEARSLGAFADSWAPEIVFLGQLPDEATRAELTDLVTRVPRVGIAAVAAGDLAGEWTLQVTDKDTAALSMPSAGDPLPLTPQCVSADELARALALLETTTESAHAAVEDWPATSGDEISIDQEAPAAHTSPEWTDIVSGYHQVPSTNEDSSTDEVVGSDTDNEATPGETSEQVVFVKETAEPERAEAPPFDEHTPWVQLLGAVQLHNAQGQEPRTPQTSEINRSAVARATELIAFLTLNPGATAVAVHDALWTGKDPSGKQAQSSRNGLASKARRWLGDSLTGEKFFPAVGANGYRLHESVRTDWDVWKELIGPNVSLTSTENLIAALRMVHGQPFAGVKEKYYGWAEVIRQEMIAAIGDAAHELVSRSLMSGRTAQARLAAAIGRQIDPVNERLWRDALRAEHQAGDIAGFERVVTQLEQHLDSFEDGYEAEPETQELISQARYQRPGTN